MRKICKKCRFFESKAVSLEKDTWGVCHKLAEKSLRSAFRWGEGISCEDFELNEESVKSNESSESPLN
jgi:hypothetical protein